jgi:predicted AAA+ superfamily ATPase
MIKRNIQEAIERSLKKYPVVSMLGSRQVGKTTLANMIKDEIRKKVIYLDLELSSDLNEIQRMPSLFPLIRALVDKKRIQGQFLILGSASPELIRHSSESLAGRIIYHELTPFVLHEIGYEHILKLWLRGGYPVSYLSENDDDSFSWRESFIKTYLERDIPQFGIHIPAVQLRRFWTMLAHSHGQLWNASQIANSMGISAPTVRNYLDILGDTFIVRQLQSYYLNIKKRLRKSPKVYIRDSGLLHTLLRVGSIENLQGHPSVGKSWEGFVIEQILGIIPENCQAFFYRTGAGAEIDLLLVNGKNEPIAIEIKYSASPTTSRGFWNAFNDLSCKKGFIVYPGKESYPLGKNVYTLPIKNIIKILN